MEYLVTRGGSSALGNSAILCLVSVVCNLFENIYLNKKKHGGFLNRKPHAFNVNVYSSLYPMLSEIFIAACLIDWITSFNLSSFNLNFGEAQLIAATALP